jgi:D-alanine-D-alanine ligase-like ATP-grasp enzyme
MEYNNINIISSDKFDSIDDLIELKIEHKEIFDAYIHKSSCAVSSWWSQFAHFYGQSSREARKPLWIIIDNLFVPFLLHREKLFLFFLPFGEGTPDTYANVLQKCYTICQKHQSNNSTLSFIRWVNADQIDFLEKSKKFNTTFEYFKLGVGPEYHYGIINLIELKGKDYSYVRRKINKLTREQESINFQPYEQKHYDALIKLNEEWGQNATHKYKSIYDKAYYPVALKHYKELDHIIIIANDKNQVVGMISGEIRGATAFCLFRKVKDNYDGLSEALMHQLAIAIHQKNPHIMLLNDGGAGSTEGLRFFKDRLKPIHRMDRFRIRVRNLQILSSRSYHGVNIINFDPSARVIVQNDNDLTIKLTKEELARVEAELFKAFGSDLDISLIVLENTPGLLMAQTAILIQQAARHTVSNYRCNTLAKKRYEISFDLFRPSLLPKLVECISKIYALLYHSDNNIYDFYTANRDVLAFGLNEFIAQERMAIARQYGLSTYHYYGHKVWIGEGKHRALLSLGYSHKTSRIGFLIAKDKLSTNDFLLKLGLPCPKQFGFNNSVLLESHSSTLKFPVVLKPQFGKKGNGVFINIKSPQELIQKYKSIQSDYKDAVVQEFIEGEEYRLLVINGKFAAAVKRIPAFIIGDGIHSIKKLIEMKNLTERRDGLYLIPIKIDENLLHVLKKQGLTIESVPQKGQKLIIREVSNVSLGGTTQDCTHEVHPDNAAAAVFAAENCQLDIAGIDFMTTDITKSWKNGYGKIIEINANPGVDLHMLPTLGEKRDVSKEFFSANFIDNALYTIPKIVITGLKHKNSIAKICHSFLMQLGYTSGLQYDDIAFIGASESKIEASFFNRTLSFLSHRSLEAAVMVWPQYELMQYGSACDQITCTVITDDLVSPILIERSYDDNINYKIYTMLAKLTTHAVIIGADNQNIYEVLLQLPVSMIVLVSLQSDSSNNSILNKHMEQNGRALFLASDRKSLNWFDGEVVHLVSKSFKVSKATLFSIASMLAIEKDLTHIQQLDEMLPTHEKLAYNDTLQHVIFPHNRLKVYLSDSRDTHALQYLLSVINLDSSRWIWIVIADDTSRFDFWHQWHEGLANYKIHFIFISEENSNLLQNSNLVPDNHSALELISCNARPEDLIIYLDLNESARYDMKQLMQNKADTIVSSKSITTDPRDLKLLFGGSWVNSDTSKIKIEKVELRTARQNGSLVIVPDMHDRSETLTLVEEAFRNNAEAVISSITAPHLPKWKRVLVCNSPLTGFIQLTHHMRSQIQGAVFAIYSNNQMHEAVAMQLSQNDSFSVSILYDQNMISKTILYENVSLEIINGALKQPQNNLIFLLNDISLMLSRTINPDFIIIDTQSITIEPGNITSLFTSKSTIFILVSKNNAMHWRNITTYMSNIQILFIESETSLNQISSIIKKSVTQEPFAKCSV